MPAASYNVLVFHFKKAAISTGFADKLIFQLLVENISAEPPGVFPGILLLRLNQIHTTYYFNLCLAEPLNILLHCTLANFID